MSKRSTATSASCSSTCSPIEELAPQFRTANTVVQYRYHKPESQITVKLLEDEDGQVDLGATQLEPEVIMTMDADIAHRFWLGKVNVTMALARGQIKAKGPVAKILKLVPLVKPVFPRYKAQLEAAGRHDLAEASAPTDGGGAGARRRGLAWRSPPMTVRWRASRTSTSSPRRPG